MGITSSTVLTLGSLLLCAGAGATPNNENTSASDTAAASNSAGAPLAAAAPPARTPAGWGEALQADRLQAARGASDAISNEARLNGVVTGNSAVNVNTGANRIDSGSFANATGLPMVIQNSGANVLIQNATVINLQLK